MGITCGIDWAEIHHDIALADETGRIIDRARIDTGAGGFNLLRPGICQVPHSRWAIGAR